MYHDMRYWNRNEFIYNIMTKGKSSKINKKLSLCVRKFNLHCVTCVKTVKNNRNYKKIISDTHVVSS